MIRARAMCHSEEGREVSANEGVQVGGQSGGKERLCLIFAPHVPHLMLFSRYLELRFQPPKLSKGIVVLRRGIRRENRIDDGVEHNQLDAGP